MISAGNLIHRSIVLGCMAFGVYGTLVIGQNMMVKKRAIQAEKDAQLAAAALPPPDQQ